MQPSNVSLEAPNEPQQEPARTVTTQQLPEKDTLLLMATERFCGQDDHSRLTVEQFKEAFYGLAGAVERDTLAQISILLKNNAHAPRQILLFLALEPVSVCGPILREAMQLSQLDLVSLIGRGGLNHATEIAKRIDLGPSIVRHLRTLNDSQVNKALKANGALLDDLEKRSMSAIFETLTTPDRKVFQADTKEETKPAFEAQSEESIAAPEVARPSAQDALLKAAARGGRIERTTTASPQEQPVSKLSSSDFAQALEKAALARSHQSLSVLMQKQLGLAFETTRQILDDKSGDTLAVLLKACEVGAAKANRIALLTFPTIGLSVQNTRRAISFYSSLKTETCLAAVDHWPKQELPAPAYQPAYSEAEGVRRDGQAVVSQPPKEQPEETAKIVNF